MTRSKRFLYSTFATALYQLTLLLAGFITPKIMLVYYGSEINGVISSINQFIIYFNLVETGLSGAAIYALYKPLADKDFNEISSVVCAAQRFYIRAGNLYLILIASLAFGYPFIVSSTALSELDMIILIFVLGCSSAMEFFTLAKYRALLSADQKTYVISFASIVHVIINTVIIYVLANLGVSIIILRTIALISVAARSVILMAYVRINYPQGQLSCTTEN